MAMTLRLDEEHQIQLKMISLVQGTSVNKVIEKAIDAYIEKLKDDEEFQAKFKTTMSDNILKMAVTKTHTGEFL